jgi:hypothetical protein
MRSCMLCFHIREWAGGIKNMAVGLAGVRSSHRIPREHTAHRGVGSLIGWFSKVCTHAWG